jgi:hypothetical protein
METNAFREIIAASPVCDCLRGYSQLLSDTRIRQSIFGDQPRGDLHISREIVRTLVVWARFWTASARHGEYFLTENIVEFLDDIYPTAIVEH